jgi:S-adenosylmethionine decarboxylase
MVNIEIPSHYTASPSSFTGTPHLTINREATVDLDSSTAFEGPEKLLEVWFAPDCGSLPASCLKDGLKAVAADTWKDMLDIVNCKVLSVLESDTVDAYLLSESSMFVWPHKLVLKTCGTTTLLSGLPRMLEIAATQAGFPHSVAISKQGLSSAATPYRIFYSRKNFLFPTQQRGPHRSWRDEVRFLDKLFLGGSAYMIGKMNGDHWYLYITEANTQLTPPHTPDREPTETKQLSLPENGHIKSCGEEDETLEILMTDLDEQNARQFYLEDASAVAEGRHYQKVRKDAVKSLGTIPEEKHIHSDAGFDVFEQTCSDHSQYSSDDDDLPLPEELTTEGHALGTVVSENCGLSDVYSPAKYPDAKVDAYIFTPCGFSANGVIPAAVDDNGVKAINSANHYFTVHVTPEPQCSYASFETNVPAHQSGRETADIVEQVVNIFKPGRFSVTLFETKKDETSASNGMTVAKKSGRMDALAGYKRVDRIVHDLDGYDLVFRYYERFDFKGSGPRLGEMNF